MTSQKGMVLGLTVIMLLTATPLLGQEKAIRKEVIVQASLNQVWEAWTTSAGASTFFAPSAHIDLTVGGPYEIYFFPEKPYGMRGTDSCRVYSIVPMKSIVFSWGAPVVLDRCETCTPWSSFDSKSWDRNK